jgi:hypothetical protein
MTGLWRCMHSRRGAHDSSNGDTDGNIEPSPKPESLGYRTKTNVATAVPTLVRLEETK